VDTNAACPCFDREGLEASLSPTRSENVCLRGRREEEDPAADGGGGGGVADRSTISFSVGGAVSAETYGRGRGCATGPAYPKWSSVRVEVEGVGGPSHDVSGGGGGSKSDAKARSTDDDVGGGCATILSDFCDANSL